VLVLVSVVLVSVQAQVFEQVWVLEPAAAVMVPVHVLEWA
jgi:hypothetical protein